MKLIGQTQDPAIVLSDEKTLPAFAASLNETALDAELLQLAVKRRARYAEPLRNLAEIAVFGYQRIPDRLSLGILETDDRGISFHSLVCDRCKLNLRRFSYVGRQILEAHDPVATEQMQPLNEVSQLANIAWPTVGEQCVQGMACETEGRGSFAIRKLAIEMLDQQQAVAPAIPQWRDMDGHRAYPVEKILAKATIGDFCLEIPVRGRDKSDLDRSLPAVAYPADRSLFEHAQQKGLHIQRHLADFIKAQNAAVGELEDPRFAFPGGAREGAANMAKQLAAEQLFGYRAAVEGNEGAVSRLAACAMDQPGKEFLADARFTFDQERRDILRFADFASRIDGRSQSFTFADDKRAFIFQPLRCRSAAD